MVGKLIALSINLEHNDINWVKIRTSKNEHKSATQNVSSVFILVCWYVNVKTSFITSIGDACL